MPLDFLTLMTVMVANLLMISVALPLIMGRNAGRAARHIQGYVLLQTVALASIIASARLWDQPLSTLSMACQAAAQWQLYRALEEWLGPRPLRRCLLVLIVAMPLGYTLGFHSYAWRVGWANGLLAAILFIVARATLYPRVPADLRATIGRDFIKRSLGRDLLPARVAALDLAARYAWAFAEIRGQGMSKKLTVEDVLASVAKNGALEYVITTPAGVRIEATTAEDHARAMEALENIGRIEAPAIAASAPAPWVSSPSTAC